MSYLISLTLSLSPVWLGADILSIARLDYSDVSTFIGELIEILNDVSVTLRNSLVLRHLHLLLLQSPVRGSVALIFQTAVTEY